MSLCTSNNMNAYSIAKLNYVRVLKLTTVLDETINEALKDSYCCLCLPKVERRPWKQFPKILLLLVNRVNYDGSRIREEKFVSELVSGSRSRPTLV